MCEITVFKAYNSTQSSQLSMSFSLNGFTEKWTLTSRIYTECLYFLSHLLRIWISFSYLPPLKNIGISVVLKRKIKFAFQDDGD